MIRASRKQRMTQREIREFVVWCFKQPSIENWSNGKVSEEYYNATGIKVHVTTVANQRNRWELRGNKLIDLRNPYLEYTI